MHMRQWVKKLFEQLDMDWNDINEDRATLLYILDSYSKHLFDIDSMPAKKARESIEEFSKALADIQHPMPEKTLFRLRQFFSSYRLDEYTYIQKTYDDFKKIIWDFADQLGEDVRFEQQKESEMKDNLDQLRDAVESNSIDELRTKSREFIDSYVEFQSKKDDRRVRRMDAIKKNLDSVRKQLTEANENLNVDHLTGACNRRSFEEQAKKIMEQANASQVPVSMIALDIDFFKKINDSYGHDIGDMVLKECVRLLKEVFHRDQDVVARIGGEEFVVILPQYRVEHAVKKAEEAHARIRKEVFLHGEFKITFTVSMGIAQLENAESLDSWLKRADTALYESKKTGRNKSTAANPRLKVA